VKVRFVSPWYPDYALVHSGIFVAKQVRAVQDAGHEVVVDVPQIFPAPPGPIPDVVTEAMKALARRSPAAMFAQVGEVTYVPTPVPSRGGPLGRALAMGQSMSLLEETRPDDSDVIHAHLGMPTALAVTRSNAGSRLVVTEHQSTLAAIFAEPEAAHAYAEVVRRADVFICVSQHLRDEVADVVGEWAREKIEVVPNIVDLTDIPFRPRPRHDFSSWIYVGGLMAHKGVQVLLRTFAAYLKNHDADARLTLVGDGPLRSWIETYATTRGFAGSIRLAGSVEHRELDPYLNQADVMVHLSPAETFGIAPLEGIGAGLPIIALNNWGTINTWGDHEQICGSVLPLETSPEEIAEAVAALRSSSDRLNGVAARQMIVDRYSSEIVAQRLVELYQKARQ
jgi:glycosyltransferase involved in cell wall biosynthesis